MGADGTVRAAFGPYALVRRVSVGGTAEIYEARDGRGHAVAIKRLLPSAGAHPDAVRMFAAEAALLERLAHPRIAAVHDVGAVDGAPYIAMAFVEGREVRALARILRERGEGAPPACVAAIGAMVADALAYVHDLADADGRPLGVVHRDISPQNMLLTDAGELSLVDFGIATFEGREERTRPGVLKGKHAYMSPEQVRGEPLDGRSDLFSLGVVLWELLAGRRLFRGDGVLDTLARVEAAAVPDLPRGAPEDVRRWILACLAADRGGRPERAGAVRDGLLGACARLGFDRPEDAVAPALRATFAEAERGAGRDTIARYGDALRAVEQGDDPALTAREASDITLAPAAAELQAHIAELRAAAEGGQGAADGVDPDRTVSHDE